MNETITHQLAHRTIRAWEPRQIDDADRALLAKVASATATSNGMQMAGIIRVTDRGIREALAGVGNQPYVASVPELWIFIVDAARNAALFAEAGESSVVPASADAFFQGFTDACLMAQNVANAAESLGLGSGFYGCIHNDTAEVTRILGLPKLTFPVLGIGIGYPAQDPALKPRIPVELRMMENTYSGPESWTEALADYDAVMVRYYDLRDTSQSVGRFTDQVLTRQKNPVANRLDIAEAARMQGFDL